MKTVLKGLTTAVIIAAAVAAPANAQTQSWGFGVHGAYFKSGTLAKSDATNTILQLDNKRTIGGNLEWWMGSGRLGLRANVDKTNSPWMLENHDNPNSAGLGGAQAQLDAAGKNVDVLMADADLMLRLLSPKVDRRFAPFISAGYGLVRWDQQTDGVPLDLRVNEVDAQVQGDNQSEGAWTGSIGTDFFLTDHVALRLEAKDYWNPSSPYIKLSTFSADDGRHQIGGHNKVYSAGLSFLFGGHKVAEPGFIAEAPAPPPPPAPAPPPPAPRVTTEQVAMCVVGDNGQLQTVTATRNLDTREITVMRNGTQTAFVTAYPANSPYYVSNASWYVASKPLVIDLTPTKDRGKDVDVTLPANRIELVNFGSTMPLTSTDLVYVGSAQGTPLYAKRTDVSADLLPDLQVRLRTNPDLSVVLGDQAFADRFSNGITTFYMPVGPSEKDCTYQPVSSTRVVRRTRG